MLAWKVTAYNDPLDRGVALRYITCSFTTKETARYFIVRNDLKTAQALQPIDAVVIVGLVGETPERKARTGRKWNSVVSDSF